MKRIDCTNSDISWNIWWLLAFSFRAMITDRLKILGIINTHPTPFYFQISTIFIAFTCTEILKKCESSIFESCYLIYSDVYNQHGWNLVIRRRPILMILKILSRSVQEVRNLVAKTHRVLWNLLLRKISDLYECNQGCREGGGWAGNESFLLSPDFWRDPGDLQAYRRYHYLSL